ncbi:MAG: hypothetical protein ACREMF_09490 [Gemmatimonadales bacterium]
MLRKLAAVILAVGLCLPYGCDVRPISGVWHDVPTLLFLGIPVLATVAYVLHTLVPPLAAFHERHGQRLHGILRMVYFVLAGGYLAAAVTKREGWPGLIAAAVALLVTGGSLTWQQGRGTKATRVPLLLLLCAGVPEIAYLVVFLKEGELQAGGWVYTAGWLLALLGESQVLKVQPTIPHGG